MAADPFTGGHHELERSGRSPVSGHRRRHSDSASRNSAIRPVATLSIPGTPEYRGHLRWICQDSLRRHLTRFATPFRPSPRRTLECWPTTPSRRISRGALSQRQGHRLLRGFPLQRRGTDRASGPRRTHHHRFSELWRRRKLARHRGWQGVLLELRSLDADPNAAATWQASVSRADPRVLENSPSLRPGIELNEVATTLPEGDWIEIHNRGATTADLADWSLTDNPSDPRRYVFPLHDCLPAAFSRVPVSGDLGSLRDSPWTAMARPSRFLMPGPTSWDSPRLWSPGQLDSPSDVSSPRAPGVFAIPLPAPPMSRPRPPDCRSIAQ